MPRDPCAINRPSSCVVFHHYPGFYSASSFSHLLMAPKRGAGRGRARRSRGGRTPRSGRGGHHGAPPMPCSSSLEEVFWQYDFFLRIRGQNATRVLLPSAFSAIVSEYNLDG